MEQNTHVQTPPVLNILQNKNSLNLSRKILKSYFNSLKTKKSWKLQNDFENYQSFQPDPNISEINDFKYVFLTLDSVNDMIMIEYSKGYTFCLPFILNQCSVHIADLQSTA